MAVAAEPYRSSSRRNPGSPRRRAQVGSTRSSGADTDEGMASRVSSFAIAAARSSTMA
jgi:hypothetical protein